MTNNTQNPPASVFAKSPTSVVQKPNHIVEPIVLDKHQQEENEWICPASAKSIRTSNPIRAIVDSIVANIKSGCQREDGKCPISLALGDPTVGGNLHPCPAAMEAVVQAVLYKPHAAGYVNACGTPEARQAIADAHSYPSSVHKISPDNVIVANGCSGALELALAALLDPETAILVPRPGFPLYQVIAESHGANVVHYNLLPDKNWECDLDHLEELMASHPNTIRAMLINNPSNPTGGVFSEEHLEQLLHFARRHHLPIVSDEVYGELVFASQTFHPLAQVASKLGNQVPVITASGLAKQYLLPGWRIGWLTFHDNIHGSLRHVEEGAKRLAQVILGASHLTQAAIPVLLSPNTPGMTEWKLELRQTLERQARFLFDGLSHCHGLQVLPSQGAMYGIVKIDTHALSIADDLEFSKKLLEEENVFVLPGSAFGVPDVFRVVFCSPERILDVAAHRIADFCLRHKKVA